MATQKIDIDTTISTLQQGLTSIPVEQAVALINSWQQQLQGTDLADDLAQDLDELKLALTSDYGDHSAALADVLTDLAEDTSEVSDNLSPDIAPKVRQLARLISQAAESLR